jgi:hypothetical protein
MADPKETEKKNQEVETEKKQELDDKDLDKAAGGILY